MTLINSLIITTLFLLPLTATSLTELPEEPVVRIAPEAPILRQVKTLPATTTFDTLINKYAEIYQVSTTTMHHIIKCESGYRPDVQSGYYQNGKREESYGLVQINLPSHPTITYEQAIDPEFSINFLAENLSKGKGSMWTCYRNLTVDS